MVECLHDTQKVAGSIPAGRTASLKLRSAGTLENLTELVRFGFSYVPPTAGRVRILLCPEEAKRKRGDSKFKSKKGKGEITN